MKLVEELNEFNRLLADYVLSVFPTDIVAFQDEDETLLFRGPTRKSNDIVTHVSVDLEKEVKNALNSADSAERLEKMDNLKRNLGMQIRHQYSLKNVGPIAKKYIGTMAILTGYDE